MQIEIYWEFNGQVRFLVLERNLGFITILSWRLDQSLLEVHLSLSLLAGFWCFMPVRWNYDAIKSTPTKNLSTITWLAIFLSPKQCRRSSKVKTMTAFAPCEMILSRHVFETSENNFFDCYSPMIGSYLLCEVSQFIVKLFEQKIRPWYIFHDWSLSEKEFI